uniref:Btz domain-containing protein n=1 Tax=Tanacetum cinerariifolium TaxID=118510 RepID=A0A699H0U9_TANCI|nr:hypothetical protein [Tanacetum cinerariifolium]
MNEKDDDYESEDEEVMRRRTVASEDEEDDEDEQVMRRRTLASDDEEDEEDDGVAGKYGEDDDDEGQGGAGEYDDDDDVTDEVEVVDDVADEVDVVDDVAVVGEVEVEGKNVEGGEGEGEGEGEGGEKKENEPFAVPTAGAFYMHDDRFRGSGGGGGGGRGRGRGGGGGRNRRTLDGRRLWETRDDRKWGHDKFEEMSVHERPYSEGRRMPRGRNRGRGRGRGDNRDFLHENRTKAVDNNYQNGASKSVRGRGQRRYRPVAKNNVEAPANNRRPSKSLEKASHASTERASAAASTSESNQVSSRNTVASSLNSASPPFYPSASSNQEINSTQKGSSQTGHVSLSNNMRELGVSDTLGMEKLYVDNSGSSYQARNKGRGQTGQTMPGQRVYQPVSSHNQANRAPSQNQPHAFQQTPSFHSAGQQLRSRSASGSQASSTPKVSGPMHSLESTELESYDSKMPLAGKGKGGNQNNGNSPFSYTGNIGGNHGDQNFPGAPTFLPVMQFAGQQHRGGITAVGMAFPGYVGQPNGMGNSEMTWLPVLAGAARGLGATGAMGAAYPPYITMDGSYHAQTPGQASSLPPALSKDGDTHEPGNKPKLFQRSELASDELGQRHNKGRRYTEMKFDQ